MKRLLVILVLTGAAFSQTWNGVLDPSRAIDWSQAGATISTTRTKCVTTACNTLTSAGASATLAQINAAIISANNSNTFVLLGPYTYTFTCSGTCIEISGLTNLTLRGVPGSTRIAITGAGDTCSGQPKAILCVESTDTSYAGGPSNATTWTASSYAAGQTTLTFADASNIQTGITPIILDQLDDTNDTGNLYIGCEFGPTGGLNANCYSGASPPGSQRPDGSGSTSTTVRGQQQVVLATACSPACPHSGATTVTISPGLYAPNWASAKSPGAWWATSPSSGIGVEDIIFDNTSGTATADVSILNCYNCWTKGIVTLNPMNAHIWVWTSKNFTDRDSYHYGNQGTSSDSYGIETWGLSNALIENNIFQKVTAPIIYNSDCEGCVEGYNFSINNDYSDPGWQNPSMNPHAPTLFILAEGNVGSNLYADSFHGTHAFVTLFRDRLDGYESNNGTWTFSNTIPVRLNPFSRYFNIIGSVLGSNGRPQTNYIQDVTTGCSGASYAAIYWFGCYPEGSAPADSLTQTSVMLWGNYDTVNAATRFVSGEVPSGISPYGNPVPGSTTLPPSFYYSAKPSWWPSGKPWPPIGPDVTGGNLLRCISGTYAGAQVSASSQCGGTTASDTAGHAYSIPAMDCYFNIMSGNPIGTGSPLAFNSATCYPPQIGVNVGAFLAPSGPTTNFGHVWSGGAVQFAVVDFSWTSIDTGGCPSSCSWSTMDSEIATYLSTYPGIKMELVFEPASDTSPNSFTPAYVMHNSGQQSAACTQYPGNGTTTVNTVISGSSGSDTTILPIMLNGQYGATQWNAFITNTIAHINAASYMGSISGIVFGTNEGGENYPQCSALQETIAGGGVSNLSTAWIAMNTTIANTISTAAPIPQPFEGIACLGVNTNTTLNNCPLFADLEAPVWAAKNIGLRVTTLAANDISEYALGHPGSSDWLTNFNTFAVPADLQDADGSNPNSLSGCTSKAGPLPPLLTFVMSHWGLATQRFYEAYLTPDLYGTFVTSYTDTPCWPNTVVSSVPYAPYNSLLVGIEAGIINPPSGVTAIFF